MGCGSRLKLFVFLDDIRDETDCPTKIAKGSQSTAFYNYGDNTSFTRFADDYVEANFETMNLFGPRGGGFLFDTNAIHRATVDGMHKSRNTIILEFHDEEKHSARIPSSGPCPSPTWVEENRRWKLH